MKLLKLLGISILVSLLIPLSSCTDPCKDKICVNGYCIEGDCFCLDAYSGEFCEIAERDKFRGNYQGQQVCPEGIQKLVLKVTDEGDDPRAVKLFIDNYSVEIMLRAKVKKDSIYIPNQWVEISYLSGTITSLFSDSKGVLKGDSVLIFDLRYYYQDGEFDTCTIQAKKD